MLGPTMLHAVGQQCCVHLHGPLGSFELVSLESLTFHNLELHYIKYMISNTMILSFIPLQC